LLRLVPTDPDASGFEHGSRLIECAHVLAQVCLAAATTRHICNKGYQSQELTQPVSFGWNKFQHANCFSRTYVNGLTAKSSNQDVCVKQITTKRPTPHLPHCAVHLPYSPHSAGLSCHCIMDVWRCCSPGEQGHGVIAGHELPAHTWGLSTLTGTSDNSSCGASVP
jgi:hypothetical protein